MRHYSKRTLVAAVLLLFFFAPRSVVFGQSNGHFEWAKGFGTGDPNGGACHITGSVTDSLGNLYILGQFRNDSEWGSGWDAESLMPMTPYGPGANTTINVIIAKISPDGEMVWKKVIHSNNGSHQTPQDIKKVGDTAFACLVEMLLPTEDRYVYYLDTLIPGRSDYPVNSMYVRNSMRTAFIMFDFEGNVIEQHFLYVTYTDTTGNDFVKYYNNDTTPWFSSDRFRNPSFDIDADGNIYICRASMDRLDDSINAANGMIRGIKFWVDNRKVGEYINDSRPMQWYPQIIKFSPHFDTMLVCKYIVQKHSDSIEYNLYDTRTIVDEDGSVYIKVIQELRNEQNNTIIVDSTNNIYIEHSGRLLELCYVVKYDAVLTPLYTIHFEDSIFGNNQPSKIRAMFCDLTVDFDSNSVFLSGFVQKNSNSQSFIFIDGHQLPMEKNDAFVLAIDATTGSYKTCAIIPSLQSSNLGDIDCKYNLMTQGNRIFLQSQYYGGIRFPDNTIQLGTYKTGLGLAIFDYSGHLVEGIDYKAMHNSKNRPGSISLQDSLLYVCGELHSDATFGNIQFSTNGNQYAYIAKYVDTSFMTPYTGDTGDVNIMLMPDVGVFTAYPNPFRQRVNIKIENTVLKAVNGTVTAILTDITGRSEEVQLAAEGDGRYVLDLTARPQASYLLTLTTDDGRQHTVHLLKQSDRFGTD